MNMRTGCGYGSKGPFIIYAQGAEILRRPLIFGKSPMGGIYIKPVKLMFPRVSSKKRLKIVFEIFFWEGGTCFWQPRKNINY